MDEKIQTEIDELSDELDIILSVKNDVSEDEICNLANKFTSLSEYDIRKKISEVTHDNSYVEKPIDEESNSPSKAEENLKNQNGIKDITYDGKVESNAGYDEAQNNDKNSEKFIEGFDEVEIENKKCDFDVQCEGQVKLQDVKDKEECPKDKDENIKDKHEVIEDGIVFDKDNIPDVTFVSGDIKYGQLSIEWGWPHGIDKVLLCYKMDKFPSGPGDSSAHHFIIDREDGFEKGDYTINKAAQGNYYFCIYTLMESGSQTLYSGGQRRLVVNKVPDEIFYEIKVRRSIFGKLKSAELVINTGSNKEIDLPELVLVGRIGNMPVQKCDGEDLFNIDYQTLKEDEEIGFDLPLQNIKRNMYVKLFFMDDSNSKLFRIVSPSKEKLYFK